MQWSPLPENKLVKYGQIARKTNLFLFELDKMSDLIPGSREFTFLCNN
jgi:hypothetical protein